MAIRVSLKFVDPLRKHPETGTNSNVVREFVEPPGRERTAREDSPRGPTPPPEDLPPADGADQDLPHQTEEERPQEEEDQPPEVVEEADDAAGVPGVQGKEGEEQEEVTVIFICDIPLLIITLIYRHFAIIWYGVQCFDFVYNYIIIILGGPLSRTTRLHLQ